uniref:Uncharacterized protein n=1 Tax=Rhizophora mucronata TaxID=61149 RepID=A0A2P2JG29_RHIMU
MHINFVSNQKLESPKSTWQTKICSKSLLCDGPTTCITVHLLQFLTRSCNVWSKSWEGPWRGHNSMPSRVDHVGFFVTLP